MEKIYVNAEKPIKKVKNFWNHIHFHPTDAIEDLWGQKILDSASKDSAAKMVRMYAMLEDAVSEDENGNLIYDFTDTDIRIDYMVSKGFKLLICMNFLPRAIAKDKNIVSANQRYKGKHIYTSVPSDYRLWQEICEKYVSHLVERYGEKLVSSWYFHCWNEPNCSGYWMSDCEDWEEVTNEYLKLYDFFAEGVKKVSSKIRIGGPSAAFALLTSAPRTDEYGKLIDTMFLKKFFNHIKDGINFANGKKGTAFDFYTVHTYGDFEDNMKTGIFDPKECTDMLINYRRLADDFGFKGIEMISDEWDICGGGWLTVDEYPKLNYRNNEIFSSHYFAMIDDILKKDIDVSAFMICLSGQHDLTKDFAGTRTLATKSGFKLPIYNAYALSAMLGQTILESSCDKNVKVIPTLCENGDIAVAVFNYSKNTAKRNGTININLKVKLPYGEYSVSHYRIDKNNCNSYSAWTELGQPEYPTQNEAEFINKAAILKKWYEDEEIKGDEYSLDIQMSDYSVSLLKLKKK